MELSTSNTYKDFNSSVITPEVRNLIINAIRKYRPYREGMKRYTGEYIVNRLKNILKDPSLLRENRILTSDVFYDLRPILEEAGIDVTSKDAIIKKRRRKGSSLEYELIAYPVNYSFLHFF